ncbi:uncharacterized protein LOC132624523 [Lycium barbarum]|uniref:uncharacterized protein LOC132624523 n=1 Tax=Lycium barbarum TaxID=112863 RepID=UPI00293E83A6|nr:uncharacterized protein LOC132624523 [Lycium barbarum]
MGGVEFEVTVDPTDAEQWLERMERVFEQLECSDAAKFKYVVSLLQKDAYDWWVSVPNAKAKPPVLTWNDFVKEFHMKYVPPAYHDAKKKEFLNLEQGGMSIAEYQQKFLRLSRYAGGIINNKKDKCRRFEDGLNNSIRKSVVVLQHKNFCKVVSAALTWEMIDKEQALEMKTSSGKLMQIQEVRLKGEGLTVPKLVLFSSQPKLWPRQDWRASGACFNCGSFDHKVKDCPNPNPTSSPRMEGSVQKPITTPSQGNKGVRSRNTQASESRATARAYAMRQRGDQDGADVVVVFPADLIEMPFQDYDVIIDMDWLHRYHAVVDCRSKHVTFRAPSLSHIIVQGERSLTSNIISAVVARKMVSQGCEAYLAHIFDTHLESPSLKDIPVVCEFPNIFPENLPGLPPEREVELPIEVIPGTTPISITPYRMAPTELKELKNQLQELLEKGFIRPSVSPWGAPVLFVKKKDFS